jgi:hypothetical protein
MTKHKCFRCGYEAIKISSVKDHLKKKKICDPVIVDMDREECLKILNQKNNEIVIEMLLFKLSSLQSQVNKLSVNQGNDNRNVELGNNNTVEKIDQSINIHISLNSYEKTDYSILKNKIHTCIKNGKVDESKLIELLHFNKEAPQNHNIKIENKRENRIKVFNGTDFEESEYTGKEGIFKFSQDTLNKTGDQEYIEEGDKTFNAIENTKDENINLDRTQKAQKIGKVTTVIYNGNKLKKKKDLIL